MTQPASTAVTDTQLNGLSSELARDTFAKLGARGWLLVLLLLTLIPRAALMPFNENLHGDAVVRTELAQRWAATPHWIISAADGAYQFGPLHLYAVGTLLKLGVDKADAGRWLSFFFGVLTVLPLFSLSRRLFGLKAAVWAGFAFAAWGFHIQMSTTAASEALSLFLVVSVLALFAVGKESGKVAPFLQAALVLNFACATRYDAWLLMPLLAGILFFSGRDRIASGTRALLFGVFCLPFPLAWMQGNEVQTGHAFEPMRMIDGYHAQWVEQAIQPWGAGLFRLWNLFFWPGAAMLTLTPFVAVAGFAGAAYVLRRRPEARWLVWVIAVPTLYFTVRSAVLADFVPLARFTVSQLVLLLPFVAVGFVALREQVSARAARWAEVTAGAVAIIGPVALAAFAASDESRPARAVAPVAALSRNSSDVRRAAAYLREHVAPNERVWLDADAGFEDIQVAFYSGLSDAQFVRARWNERPSPGQPVSLLLRFRGGLLRPQALVVGSGRDIEVEGARFEPVDPQANGALQLFRFTGFSDAPAPERRDVDGAKPQDPADDAPGFYPG